MLQQLHENCYLTELYIQNRRNVKSPRRDDTTEDYLKCMRRASIQMKTVFNNATTPWHQSRMRLLTASNIDDMHADLRYLVGEYNRRAFNLHAIYQDESFSAGWSYMPFDAMRSYQPQYVLNHVKKDCIAGIQTSYTDILARLEHAITQIIKHLGSDDIKKFPYPTLRKTRKLVANCDYLVPLQDRPFHTAVIALSRTCDDIDFNKLTLKNNPLAGEYRQECIYNLTIGMNNVNVGYEKEIESLL